MRKLTALEMAEGALLATIAVVLHLLGFFLPVVGPVFSLLVPPVFAILVLRRGLYTSLVALCVAIFIVGLFTGLNAVLLTFFEVGAGVFLGVAMRYRLHYLPVLFVGVTGSAAAFFGATMLSILFIGKSFLNTLLQGLRVSFKAAFAVMNFIAPQIGLGGWWQHSAYPALRHITDLALIYWPWLIFLSDWFILLPAVIAVYYLTTFLVRLLGYQVPPFPDGLLNRLLRWATHLALRLALRLGLGKFRYTRALMVVARRQMLNRGRQNVS